MQASAVENEDLFWGLRGGGGNFGAVTSLEFRAHPVHTVVGGLLLYPRDAAVDVIRHFRDFIESAPDELTAYAACIYTPDGTPVVAVVPCYCGAASDAERVLQPLRGFGSPIVDTIQAMPFPAMQSLFGPSFPDGNHNYWKSSLLGNLSDDAITTMVEHSKGMTSPLSALILEYYGGAAGRVANDATAFPHRDLPWDVILVSQWTQPAETPRHREWARAGAEALRPFSGGAHLLGALDVEPEDVINSAFGSKSHAPGCNQGKIRPRQPLSSQSEHQTGVTRRRVL